MAVICRESKSQPSKRPSLCERIIRGIRILDDRMIKLLNKDVIEEHLIDSVNESLEEAKKDCDDLQKKIKELEKGSDRFPESNIEGQRIELMLKLSQHRRDMESLKGFREKLITHWRTKERLEKRVA